MPQYKAGMHMHTTNSDGEEPLYQVIEEHYRKGFDICTVHDHNYLTRDWIVTNNGVTPERFAEMAAGVGRGGRGMLQVPLTNEQTPSNEHLNTWFVDLVASNDFRHGFQVTQNQNGLSHINHPGRTTGGDLNAAQSNSATWINYYVGLFNDFSTCVGHEIINKKDGESRNDRILWDNINQSNLSLGRRRIWGFSNDDAHRNIDVGFSFNVFISSENTVANFRSVMSSGTLYAVARIARNESVNAHVPIENPNERIDLLGLPVPVIRSITVNPSANTITIVAENYTRIDWIRQGTTTVSQGATFNLNNTPVSGSNFIRANVISPGAIAFTQPFSIPLQAGQGWQS